MTSRISPSAGTGPPPRRAADRSMSAGGHAVIRVSGGDQLAAPLQARERIGDPLEGRGEVLPAVRVAEAQVALAVAAEGRPGQPRTPASYSRWVAISGARPPERADVGEDVERPVRHDAGDPGDRVQPVDDELATGDELGPHRIGRVLRSGQRGDRAGLGEGVRAADRVDHQPAVGRASHSGTTPYPEPPAGHGEGLREAVERDRPVRHAGQGGDRSGSPLVLEPAVDLIGQDHEVVADARSRRWPGRRPR